MNAVDAVQVPYEYPVNGGRLRQVAAWCGGEATVTGVLVTTAGGLDFAGPGWWIIRGVDGRFTVMSPGLFGAKYEAAS